MTMIIEPRSGDAEDDASSTKKRSLLAIAGSLLAEVNLPKLAIAWIILALLPAALLGFAPLVASAWFTTVSDKAAALAGIGPLFVLVLVAAVGLYGVRPLFRAVERSFWSLNSLVVQPGYTLCREGLRHLAEGFLTPAASEDRRARLRAGSALGAGLGLCLVGAGIAAAAWPATRWFGEIADLAYPLRLVAPALANTLVLMGGYLAAASFAWGLADATMYQPRDFAAFDDVPASARRWRVAHLSDIHAVGERYGFRIESGRAGPRGNERLAQAFKALDAIHAEAPLDLVLITGDLTDAGRSAEWAEFFDVLSRYPGLVERTCILPGNHDVNIVDRANPARLELPTSPGRRLRQMRALSAMAAVQGDRAHVVDASRTRLGGRLSDALQPHRQAIAAFADRGTLRLSTGLAAVWADAFPMVLPPTDEDGLGVVLLNSNAETHFSFTNALGLVAEEDMRALLDILSQFPRARWVIALHHHPVEYPKPAKALSERIGTALINGSRFVRRLEPLADRIIVMHGHRHIDWIGSCGRLKIVSAPSPVMGDGRPADLLLHPHAGRRVGRPARPPAAAAHRPEAPAARRRHALTASPATGACTLAGEPNSSASQRLEGWWAQKVRTAMVIGTPMKAPKMPHSQLQKNTENSTIAGDIDRALPATRGSM
jgi:predicted MPP superfamily phosphohydrolase